MTISSVYVTLFMRLATLAARFAFMFFLAKFLEPSDLGLYGLLTSAVGYSIYLVGLDFYTYVTREVISAPSTERALAIKSQIALSLLLYLLFIPPIVAILYAIQMPPMLIIWFVPILVLEHINQEIFRLLVALSQQTAASIVLFLRQGSWGIVIAAAWMANPATADLSQVFAAWVIAGLAASSVGIFVLSRQIEGGWNLSIDWPWIWKGIKISIAFLVATLALRGVQTMDRYFMESVTNLETVGAYVFYLGIAGSLLSFLDAGLFSHKYPYLVKLARKGDWQNLAHNVRILFILTVFWSAAFVVAAMILVPHLLALIARDAYSANYSFFLWVLAATVLNAVGLVPHYALYALGNDRSIIKSHLAGFFGFCIVAFSCMPVLGADAILIAVVVAFGLIAAWNFGAYLKFKPLSREATMESLK